MEHFDTVDEYIASRPDEVQTILQEIRRRNLTTVPGAEVRISYGIPREVPDGDEDFEREIAPFRAANGERHRGGY